MRLFKRIIVFVLIVMCASHAWAHEEAAPQSFHDLISDWEFDPLVVILLGLSGGLYFSGLLRLWKIVGIGNGIKWWEAGAFGLGLFFTVFALISPLHALSHALFSAHMVQHEILMLIAAPCFVLGRPMIALLKGLPREWSVGLARMGNRNLWQRFWQLITFPLVAWFIHAFALWTWHIPFLFQATLNNDFIHSLQHLSFLMSALLFWWALMHGRQRAMGYGIAVLYVFTTALHSGLLGAIITLADKVLYPAYSTTTQSWGLTPLEDQQLGGLIMWIPACLAYVFAGLALFAGWMRESELRVRAYQTELKRDPFFNLP